MFFRPTRSTTLTLHQARATLSLSLLPSKNGGASSSTAALSKDQIQEAYRVAAKKFHPDSSATGCSKSFQKCHDARELLLDYYIRKKHISPDVLYDENLSASSLNNANFRMDMMLRLSMFGIIAGLSLYHDYYVKPFKREQKIRDRDRQFMIRGPDRSCFDRPSSGKR